MLETIAIVVIVGVAALFLVRHFYRAASGEESACQCCEPSQCPLAPETCVQQTASKKEPNTPNSTGKATDEASSKRDSA